MKKIILYVVFYLIYPGAFAQLDQNPPVIDSVSVNPINNDVYISWSYANVNPTDTFFVNSIDYSVNPERGTGIPIDTVYPGMDYYSTDISGKAGLQSTEYDISIIRTGEDGFSSRHGTIFLSSEYDSCESQIILEWSDYKGWNTDEIMQYDIYNLDSGKKAGESENNSFIIGNINANQIYRYFVRAINRDGRTSSSNATAINTKRPKPPDFIKANYSTIASGGSVDLSFTIDPASELDSFVLFRSEYPDMSLKITLGSYKAEDIVNHTINDPSEFTSSVFYYQLAAVDGCGRYSTSSETINNIILSVENEENINIIRWNPLLTQESVYYRLTRFNNGNFTDIASLSEPGFEDNLELLKGQNLTTEICYKIYVQTLNNSMNGISESNTTCISLEPEVFIPGSINLNGMNRSFIPVFSFKPVNYELKIYNKQGNLVFSSTDVDEAWHPQNFQEGVYFYHLQYDLDHTKKINKSGYVMVLTM